MRFPGGCDWRQRCFTLPPYSLFPSHYNVSQLRPIFWDALLNCRGWKKAALRMPGSFPMDLWGHHMGSSLAWLQGNERHVACWSIGSERAAHLQPLPSPHSPRRKAVHTAASCPGGSNAGEWKQGHNRDNQCKSELDQAKARSARWGIWLTLQISQQYWWQITSASLDSTVLLCHGVIVHPSCNDYKFACLLRTVNVRFCITAPQLSKPAMQFCSWFKH